MTSPYSPRAESEAFARRVAAYIEERRESGAYDNLAEEAAELDRRAKAGEIVGVPADELVAKLRERMAEMFPEGMS